MIWRKVVLASIAAVSLTSCGTTVPVVTGATGQMSLNDPLGEGVLDPGVSASPVGAVDGFEPGIGLGPRGATGEAGATFGGSRGGAASTKRGPIKVGVLTADYAALLAAVGAEGLPDTQDFARVLVKGINARGGMAGRQIDPVYYSIDGSAPDYSSQYQAACDTFTRDNRVEAVVAQDGIDLLWACLLKAGIPAIVWSNAVNIDSTARRAYPNVFQPPGLPVDRMARAAITQSVATGWLTTKNRLGVITSGCDWGARVYDTVIVPAARQHRIPVERFALDCPTPGAALLGEYSSAIQSAALQFRSNGVDRVMFAADNDAAAYVFFTRNADSQRWYPGYIGGSTMGARGWAAAGVTTREQAENTRGVSWGKFDVDTRPATTAPMRECLDLVKAGGASPPADEGSQGLYYAFCDGFLPLRAGLERSGGIGGPALRPALESLGTSYVGASVIDGVIELRRDRHEGVANAAFFAYLATCSCFRHTARPQPA